MFLPMFNFLFILFEFKVITVAKGWWPVDGCYLSSFFMKNPFFFLLGVSGW